MCGSSGREPEGPSGGFPSKGLQKLKAICAIMASVISALVSCVKLLPFLRD
ncbi:hypothetical protein ACFV08_00630 [Streptomyces fradiae]|uniref:hypothetical protein n=1 Tax=Streptomyces fradiae TaxID=1906 RepID=UPI003691376D